jgi:multiple antibiotic resistance protein
MCGATFARIQAGQPGAARVTDATVAALAVLVILVVAALAGARVLQVFGKSLDAFSVAAAECCRGLDSPCCARAGRAGRLGP